MILGILQRHNNCPMGNKVGTSLNPPQCQAQYHQRQAQGTWFLANGDARDGQRPIPSLTTVHVPSYMPRICFTPNSFPSSRSRQVFMSIFLLPDVMFSQEQFCLKPPYLSLHFGARHIDESWGIHGL